MKGNTVKYWKWIIICMMITGLAAAAHAGSGEPNDVKHKLSEMEKRIAALEAEKRTQTPASDFRAFWKEGLNLETGDGNFKMKIGGRVHTDWFWSSEDDSLKADTGEQEDGVEIRRARIYLSGLMYENIEYKLQLDFAGAEVAFKDAYLGITDLPIGKIRMGHFYEPFGLETVSSSNYNTFIERSLITAFAPERQTGFMLHNTLHDDRIYGAVGVFRETDDDGENVDDGGYNVTGRIAALPIYENKGESLLQIGASYSFRNPDDSLRIRQRPEAHLAEYIVDTGTLTCDRENLLGLESVWINGPMSVQAEYMRADADLLNNSDASFDGFYVQGSYFLTGEHRNYNTKEAAFGRVKPKKIYGYGDGLGAWELKARYSELNLDDDSVTGGKVNDITAGVNWYLNPNTRIMWDYIHADKEDSGQADMLMMRLQFDF
jgi:phosphate-selective porin OprO and OprP